MQEAVKAADNPARNAGEAAGGTDSLNKRVGSNFIWTLISEASGRGVFILTNIYLARVLKVESFGMFALAQTLTLYFWLAVDLGTNMYGIREIAKDKDNVEAIANPLLFMRVAAGLVIFLLYVAVLFIMDLPMKTRLTFAASGVYLVTYAFYTDWVLKGLEKFKYIAYGSVVASAIYLAGTVAFVKADGDVVAACLIWSLSYFFGSLSLLFLLRYKLGIKLAISTNMATCFMHLKESIYFSLSGGLMVLYNYVPLLLVGVYFTNYEVGIFYAPFRVILAIATAGYLIPASFYPALSQMYQADRAGFAGAEKKLRTLMLLIGLPFAVAGAIWAGPMVRLLFGSKYTESGILFKMMVWLVPLYFLRNAYRVSLLAGGFHKRQYWGFVFGLAGVLVIGLLVIPKYGVNGAGVSLLASEAIVLAAMWGISHYSFKEAK